MLHFNPEGVEYQSDPKECKANDTNDDGRDIAANRRITHFDDSNGEGGGVAHDET